MVEEHMKIYGVIQEVAKKYDSLLREHGNDLRYQPRLVIYMTGDYYDSCMREIRGSVSPALFEFYDRNTIMGYSLYIVLHPRTTSNSKKHSPFRIVEI